VRPVLSPAVYLFICLFAAQSGILVLSPVLPAVAEDLGVSVAAAGQLRAVSGLAAGLAAVVLLRFGRRLPLERILDGGLVLLGAGSVLSALAPSFAALLAAQVVLGAAVAALLSGSLAAASAWGSEGDEARVLSWALIGQPVAWVVGQPLAGAIGSVSWRLVWIAVPLVTALVGLAATRACARRPGPDGRRDAPGGLGRGRDVVGWAGSELAASAAWAGTLVYAGALLGESYDVGPGTVGLVLGAGAAAYLPGNFLARRWSTHDGGRALVAFPVAGAVGSAAFGAVRPSLVVSAVLFAALAVVGGGRTYTGAAAGLALAHGHRLAAMSVRTAALQFGYLVGSVVGGVALGVGGYPALGLAFAGLFLLSAVPHAVARRRRLTAGPQRAAA
jgi:predicted MFS family arabinose efflux permease